MDLLLERGFIKGDTKRRCLGRVFSKFVGVIEAAFAICFLHNWSLVDSVLVFLEDKG